MKLHIHTLALSAILAVAAHAQTAITTPVGYVTITCPANSDTIVGVPLKQPTVAAGALSGAPTVNADSATLSITGADFTANQFAGTHYVKFTGTGNSAGKYYAVTGNTTNTITVDLNGDTLNAAQNDTLSVTKFWTLGELFDPTKSTTDPATTGNAIVASNGTSTLARKTQILLPNNAGSGINLVASQIFYVNSQDQTWRKSSDNTGADFSSQQLWPDTYVIIRHPNIAASTSYVVCGEVEMGNFQIPINTLSTGSQDNYIALPRPVDIKLDDLNLGGTAAFVDSASTSTLQRRDQLFVYNNGFASINKTPSAIYYRHNGAWRLSSSDGSANFGANTIPAGAGIVIRKYQTANGATVFWNNSATY